MKALAENQVVLLGITFIFYYGVLLLQKKYNYTTSATTKVLPPIKIISSVVACFFA